MEECIALTEHRLLSTLRARLRSVYRSGSHEWSHTRVRLRSDCIDVIGIPEKPVEPAVPLPIRDRAPIGCPEGDRSQRPVRRSGLKDARMGVRHCIVSHRVTTNGIAS